MKANNTNIIMQNKVFLWIAAATAAILSIPLIAMQFSNDWDWHLTDFAIMGTLLFGTGFAFVQVARVIPRKYWVITGIAFLAVLLYIWAELAVGIFTNLGN